MAITDEALKPADDPNAPLPAKTTNQEDIAKAGQRVVNLMWEKTQSTIALTVIFVGLGVNGLEALIMIFLTRELSSNQIAIISICLQFINITTGIVIGFYFSRTNHTNVGGVGPAKKDTER